MCRKALLAGLLLCIFCTVGFSDQTPPDLVGVRAGEEASAHPSRYWSLCVTMYETLEPVVLILMEASDVPNAERAWPHPSIALTPMRSQYMYKPTASTPPTDHASGYGTAGGLHLDSTYINAILYTLACCLGLLSLVMGLLGLGMGSVLYRICRRCRDPRLRRGLNKFIMLKSTRAAEIAAAKLKEEQEAAAKAKADTDAKTKKLQAKDNQANGGKMGLLTRFFHICPPFLARPAPPAPKPVGKRTKLDKTPTPATPKKVVKKEIAQPWLVRLLLKIDWVEYLVMGGIHEDGKKARRNRRHVSPIVAQRQARMLTCVDNVACFVNFVDALCNLPRKVATMIGERVGDVVRGLRWYVRRFTASMQRKKYRVQRTVERRWCNDFANNATKEVKNKKREPSTVEDHEEEVSSIMADLDKPLSKPAPSPFSFFNKKRHVLKNTVTEAFGKLGGRRARRPRDRRYVTEETDALCDEQSSLGREDPHDDHEEQTAPEPPRKAYVPREDLEKICTAGGRTANLTAYRPTKTRKGPTYADVLVGNFVPSMATTPDAPSTDNVTDAGKPDEEAESADVSIKTTEKNDNRAAHHLRRKSSTLQTEDAAAKTVEDDAPKDELLAVENALLRRKLAAVVELALNNGCDNAAIAAILAQQE